jgi:hypothetical protein
MSSQTSITVSWTPVADKEIPTSGYNLYMDNGDDGDFSLIMNGENHPGKLSYTANYLKPNTIYRFKVSAVNFNGEGLQSTETLIQTCSPPSNLSSPNYVSST